MNKVGQFVVSDIKTQDKLLIKIVWYWDKVDKQVNERE